MSDLLVLNDFFEEGESSQDEMDRQYKKTNKQIADLEFLQMLSAPEDKFNAVLKINGVGATVSTKKLLLALKVDVLPALSLQI